MNYIQIALNWLAFGFGGALLLAAVFFYEDEETKLQSRLEGLWVWSQDLPTRTENLVRKSARLSADMIGLLFGQRLFSIQALAVASGIAFLALLFGDMLFSPVMKVLDLIPPIHRILPQKEMSFETTDVSLLAAAVIVLLILGCASRHRVVAYVCRALNLILFANMLAVFSLASYREGIDTFIFRCDVVDDDPTIGLILLLSSGWVLSTVIAAIALPATRFILSRIGAGHGFADMLGGSAALLAVSVALVCAPLFLGARYHICVLENLAHLSMPAALAIASLFLVAILGVCQRVITPPVARLIYALQRFKPFEHRKMMAMTGAAFCSLASPQFKDLVLGLLGTIGAK